MGSHREAKQGKKAAKRAAAAAAAAEAGLGDGAPGRTKPDPSRKDEEEEGEAYELGPRRQLREAAEGRRAASLPVKVDGELVYGQAGGAAAAPQVSHACVVVLGAVSLQVRIQSGCTSGWAATPQVGCEREVLQKHLLGLEQGLGRQCGRRAAECGLVNSVMPWQTMGLLCRHGRKLYRCSSACACAHANSYL